MKNTLTAMITVVLIGLAAPAAFAEPAVTLSGVDCVLYLPSSTSVADGLFESSGKTKKVFNKGGNAGSGLVSCHADLPAGETPPAETEHFNADNPHPDAGFEECFLKLDNDDIVSTRNWTATVTPSGKSHLSCHFK